MHIMLAAAALLLLLFLTLLGELCCCTGMNKNRLTNLRHRKMREREMTDTYDVE
jgi:hypothetical protein